MPEGGGTPDNAPPLESGGGGTPTNPRVEVLAPACDGGGIPDNDEVVDIWVDIPLSEGGETPENASGDDPPPSEGGGTLGNLIEVKFPPSEGGGILDKFGAIEPPSEGGGTPVNFGGAV